MIMGKFRTVRRKKRVYEGNQHLKIEKDKAICKPKSKGRPRKKDVVPRPLTSTPVQTSEQSSAASSRSSQKISAAKMSFSDVLGNVKESTETGYRLLDIEIICNIIQSLSCPECTTISLVLKDDLTAKNGFANHFILSCKECLWSKEFFTSKKVKGSFEVNKRFVYGMRCIGTGFAGAKKFCSVMNIPSMPTRKNYDKLNKSLKTAVFDVAQESMTRAGLEVKNLIGKKNTDCGVSVDGSWQKRGFVSLNGFVSAISMDTGKVLDVEPMSKHCKSCEVHAKLDRNSSKFKSWQRGHACKANFEGSSAAMEPEGAKRIFERSVEKHSLRYTDFYGDGDSKSFPAVQNVYDGKLVQKLECIGHVQKRMGTALRKLKKEKKGLGGKGKLTNKMVDKIQNYYGIAIRSNAGNLNAMKNAILAVLFHCASSKDNNYHSYCPGGKDSWCKYKADIENKTCTFKPGSGLPLQVIALLKPIFARLSDDNLLNKCLHGKTQNQNECFNRVVWDRVPKGTFVGRDVFEIGIFEAVSNFNDGATAIVNVLQHCGLEPGMHTLRHCEEIDKSRIASSDYQQKEISKLSRKRLRRKRKSKDDKNQQQEGETYGAGQF